MTDISDYRAKVGETFTSDWLKIEQDRVNAFADITNDHNFIQLSGVFPEGYIDDAPSGHRHFLVYVSYVRKDQRIIRIRDIEHIGAVNIRNGSCGSSLDQYGGANQGKPVGCRSHRTGDTDRRRP